MSAWYVFRNGETCGPFDAAALSEGLRSGAFTTADLFWDEPSNAWRPLAEHALLAAPAGVSPAPPAGTDAAASAAAKAPRFDGPFASADFAALLSTLEARAASNTCTRHADQPAVFNCDACGGDFCLKCLDYHRGEHLCSSCRKLGKRKPVEALSTENPVSSLLLRHAWAWALLLVLVPLVVFRIAAGFLDPYRGFPEYHPAMSQTLQILKVTDEMADAPWAHAIRSRFLEIALERSAMAFEAVEKAPEPRPRAAAYLLRLIVLDRAGKFEEGAKLVAAAEIDPGQDPERSRKHRFQELLLLARTGNLPAILERYRAYAPRPVLQGEMPIFRPPAMPPAFAESPMFSGRKAYDIDVEKRVYELIVVDDARLEEALRESIGAEKVALLVNEAEPQTDEGDGEEWRQRSMGGRLDYLRRELKKYEEFFAPRFAAIAAMGAKNRAVPAAAFGRAVTEAARTASGGAAVEVRVEERTNPSYGPGGIEASFRTTARGAQGISSFLASLRLPSFPCVAVPREVGLHARGDGKWEFSAELFAPQVPEGLDEATIRKQLLSADGIDTAACTQVDIDLIDAALQSLRRKKIEWERIAAGLEVFSFDTCVRVIVADVRAAGLKRLSLRGKVLNLSGESKSEAGFEALKTRLAAPTAAGSIKMEEESTRSTSSGGSAEVEWSLELTSP